MKYSVTIQQKESRLKGKETFHKSIEIFNDNYYSSIDFETLGIESDGKFIDCIDELLKYLVEAYKYNMGDTNFQNLMDSICENGISVVDIDGTLYDWDTIKHNFDNLYDD